MPPMIWNRKKYNSPADMKVQPKHYIEGYQFTIKGSPRHYFDVANIIQNDGTAQVYFGEPLAYERGAGIALWRVRAQEFGWLNDLYKWWVEAERTEPVMFTMHLYLPSDLKYPALDLRLHTATDVEAFIRKNAPYNTGNPYSGVSALPPRRGVKIPL